MSNLDERKANTADFLAKQAAYYNGILNVPQEAVKYAGLGANWIGNKLGLRNDQEAVMAANDIKQFTNNPPFLPQAVNDFRNNLAQQNPEMDTVGNVVGSSLTGSTLYKAIMENMLSKTPKFIPAGRTFALSAPAATRATVNSTTVQPYLENSFVRSQ
jgi:hypothetical protein